MNGRSLTLLVVVLPLRPLKPPGLEGSVERVPKSVLRRISDSLWKKAKNWGIGLAIVVCLVSALWATGTFESASYASSIDLSLVSRCDTATNNVSVRRKFELH